MKKHILDMKEYILDMKEYTMDIKKHIPDMKEYVLDMKNLKAYTFTPAFFNHLSHPSTFELNANRLKNISHFNSLKNLQPYTFKPSAFLLSLLHYGSKE
jgi:hypothetical protein